MASTEGWSGGHREGWGTTLHGVLYFKKGRTVEGLPRGRGWLLLWLRMEENGGSGRINMWCGEGGVWRPQCVSGGARSQPDDVCRRCGQHMYRGAREEADVWACPGFKLI
jgi:hypothetical protein